MKKEVKRIDPIRTANILALIYGVMTLVIALLFSPFILLGLLFSPSTEAGVASSVIGGMMLVMYPIIGVVSGWIGGALFSVVFNFVSRWTGGFLVELEDAAA